MAGDQPSGKGAWSNGGAGPGGAWSRAGPERGTVLAGEGRGRGVTRCVAAGWRGRGRGPGGPAGVGGAGGAEQDRAQGAGRREEGRDRGPCGPWRCSELSGPLGGWGGSGRPTGEVRRRHGAGAALRDLPEPRPDRLQPGGATGWSRARAPRGAAALPRWARGPLGAGWSGRGSGGCALTCGKARAGRKRLPVVLDPGRPFRLSGVRVGSTRAPRLLRGGLGGAGGASQTRRDGRPAAVGAEHGGPLFQSFRFCPSCRLFQGAGAQSLSPLPKPTLI